MKHLKHGRAVLTLFDYLMRMYIERHNLDGEDVRNITMADFWWDCRRVGGLEGQSLATEDAINDAILKLWPKRYEIDQQHDIEDNQPYVMCLQLLADPFKFAATMHEMWPLLVVRDQPVTAKVIGVALTLGFQWMKPNGEIGTSQIPFTWLAKYPEEHPELRSDPSIMSITEDYQLAVDDASIFSIIKTYFNELHASLLSRGLDDVFKEEENTMLSGNPTPGGFGF
jgi:hypothetical protein